MLSTEPACDSLNEVTQATVSIFAVCQVLCRQPASDSLTEVTLADGGRPMLFVCN